TDRDERGAVVEGVGVADLADLHAGGLQRSARLRAEARRGRRVVDVHGDLVVWRRGRLRRRAWHGQRRGGLVEWFVDRDRDGAREDAGPHGAGEQAERQQDADDGSEDDGLPLLQVSATHGPGTGGGLGGRRRHGANLADNGALAGTTAYSSSTRAWMTARCPSAARSARCSPS